MTTFLVNLRVYVLTIVTGTFYASDDVIFSFNTLAFNNTRFVFFKVSYYHTIDLIYFNLEMILNLTQCRPISLEDKGMVEYKPHPTIDFKDDFVFKFPGNLAKQYSLDVVFKNQVHILTLVFEVYNAVKVDVTVIASRWPNGKKFKYQVPETTHVRIFHAYVYGFREVAINKFEYFFALL